jgi:hypothetical protein
VSALDNERDTGLRSANTERRDLLSGREKRLRRAYQEKANAQQYQLGWVHDAIKEREGHPRLTVAQYDVEVGDGLRLANAEMQVALREWLVAREELAALEGKKR